MRPIQSPILIAILCWWLAAPTLSRAEVGLRFEIPGEPAIEHTISGLRGTLGEGRVELLDPHYGKTKRYLGLELHRVLREAFGARLDSGEYSHLVFVALDGYTAIAEIPTSLQPGGWITFADLDHPNWEPIDRRQTNPGPLYLLWSGAEQLPKNGYPWPWQLAAIRLIRFRDQYPELYPDGVAEGTGVYRGFETFRARCLRCHALNRQGGQIGPDLNAPRNVLSYRSAEMVKELILRPSAYRYTKMPDHADLGEAQLDELVEYLWFMRGRSPGVGTGG